ncbi:MAG: PTS sugar transporter subunit IIA [Desulfamplus sp.]|nr:PTS sugar transporter subunit IIA [Desulfamplus sp.]
MRRSLTEIANDLGLNLDTLDRWIRQGKIPVNKQGNMGLFNESELNRWAEKQRKTPMTPDDDQDVQKGAQNDNTLCSRPLFSALKRGGIFSNIPGKSKDEAIKSVVDLVPDFPEKNSAEIYNQLMEREKLASTGIGQGVAIPHPRNPLNQGGIEPMIVTCFLQNSIDFDAIDDKPVSVMFLILSPTVEHHLDLLSRLSFCLRDRDFMSFVRQKPDADSFLIRIKEMENMI